MTLIQLFAKHALRGLHRRAHKPWKTPRLAAGLMLVAIGLPLAAHAVDLDEPGKPPGQFKARPGREESVDLSRHPNARNDRTPAPAPASAATSAASRNAYQPRPPGEAADAGRASEPAGSQPLSGMARGTRAAGNAIERGDAAARRGIQNGADRATAGPRRVGEAFGRMLSRDADGPSSATRKGPQSEAN